MAENDGLIPRPGYYSADCFSIGTAVDGTPVVGVAFILNNLSARMTGLCVRQEVTQLLGLGGDTDGRSDSLFVSSGGSDHLTEADHALLQILYDHRLRNGMSEGEAMPVVRRIIAEQFPAGP